MEPTISNIRMLANAGVLDDRTQSSPSLNFLRYNLIYGFNGSGKSTLARLFTSLKEKTTLPPDCRCHFELTDGTVCSSGDDAPSIGDRLLIFNNDFIRENLQWDSSTALPIFHIGKEQATAANMLRTLKNERLKLIGARPKAIKTLKDGERAVKEYKKNAAGRVSDLLNQPGRKYEAPQFEKDIGQYSASSENNLTEEKLSEAIATCRLNGPMAAVSLIQNRYESIHAFLKAYLTIIRRNFGIVAVKELQKHPEMYSWLDQGLKFHERHDMKECMFCGSELSGERLNQLAQFFNGKFAVFQEEIRKAMRMGAELKEEWGALKELLARPEQIYEDLQDKYKITFNSLRAAVDALLIAIDSCQTFLQQKLTTPTISTSPRFLTTIGDVRSAKRDARNAINSANNMIAQHNERVERFTECQSDAREYIRRSFSAQFYGEYMDHAGRFESAQRDLDRIERRTGELEEEISKLELTVRRHGPAASSMNGLIRAYLGHSELQIQPVDDGYEIRRNGRRAEGPPSEGEQTAIALSYFVTTLNAEDRRVKDLIVVLDDPISSLDSSALNYACSMIKNRFDAVSQLFLFTHNHQCMNEFKKAWRGRYSPKNSKEPTARYLYLDVAIPDGEDSRASRIVDLPKFLAVHDSEYYFLFDHLLKYEASTNSSYVYAYMMPNVLRRVLEVFLAFRRPGISTIKDQIASICKAHPNLESDPIGAIERLVQLESHSDNLDDLIQFSPMTIEETERACRGVLQLINEVDADHLTQMRKMCGA